MYVDWNCLTKLSKIIIELWVTCFVLGSRCLLVRPKERGTMGLHIWPLFVSQGQTLHTSTGRHSSTVKHWISGALWRCYFSLLEQWLSCGIERQVSSTLNSQVSSALPSSDSATYSNNEFSTLDQCLSSELGIKQWFLSCTVTLHQSNLSSLACLWQPTLFLQYQSAMYNSVCNVRFNRLVIVALAAIVLYIILSSYNFCLCFLF